MNIFKLQTEVWKIAEEKGWHEKEVTFGEFIANCHAELSEAFEYYRVNGDDRVNTIEVIPTISDELDKPQGIPIELADVIMRILDYCETNGVAIYQAIEMKMIFNKTRDHRHGGKVI